MNLILPPPVVRNSYPTADGKPMAETDWHRDLMAALVETLKDYYRDKPRVYVSGNLLIFYEEGNKRKHVSPDVFIVKGVPKRDRPNYLVWEEKGKFELVIEITSASTRSEDVKKKFALYRDRLKVKEYFLFDPDGDYLAPRIQGYRLRKGKYQAIRPVARRLPSRVLSLHFEPWGRELRLWNPVTRRWLATLREEAAAAGEAHRLLAEARQILAQAQRQQEELRQRYEAENERLRREVEELRRQLGEEG